MAMSLYSNGNITTGIVEIHANAYTPLYVVAMSKYKMKLKACLASVARGDYFEFGDSQRYYQNKDRKFKTFTKLVYCDKERYYYGEAYSTALVGKKSKYMLSTNKSRVEDFYHYLMNHYTLPLLEEWSEYLFRRAYELGRIYSPYNAGYTGNGEYEIFLNNEWVKVKDVSVFLVDLTQEQLEEIVSSGIRGGEIRVSDVPSPDLTVDGMDDYIVKFKKSLWKNICERIRPLVNVKSSEIYARNVVLKKKRLFEKQQERVMGAVRSLQSGVKYALLNEGMGVGKTIQSLSIIEEFFNSLFLRKHPDKELKDCYERGAVKYRNIIVAPAHLTEKWKKEIEEEIPGAEAIILNDLSQLIKIREEGPAPVGKQFYAIGKDFCKLGTWIAPVPNRVKTKEVALPICKSCYDEDGKEVFKNPDGTCSVCSGREFITVKTQHRLSGMVCPSCDNLLLQPSIYHRSLQIDDYEKRVLTPADFAGKNTKNATCFCCNEQLWGASVKNINCGGFFGKMARRDSKWRKIKHYSNCAKKSTTTAFVLKGYEQDYLGKHTIKPILDIEQGGYEYVAMETGPRRVAPAYFIKKYLKGYFDFCILDEVHKFEGEGTAQSNAAQAIVKASKYSLGLTGTISNGTATCIYSLLWLLEPQRMRERGWSRTGDDMLRFAKTYGTVETVYEVADNHLAYNKTSRGKMIQSPKVKPGISPRLFLDFLIDRGVFLDITDLGKILPPLEEKISLIDMPDDVKAAYGNIMHDLKGALHTPDGSAAISNILQMGLSYPDKPYGRNPIMSTKTEGYVLAEPENLINYATGTLLPKEERLVDIVKQEISEGRNCFIYCSYTGEGEGNVIHRLGEIVETHCNLRNRVCVINSTSPAPNKREEYIKKQAAKGIKVFLINPKCCETGLDFCFDYEGQWYNYPTIIFYQLTYELAVLWQASRRHYRANQKLECRTYWLAYRDSLQTAALEIMAQKQVAVSAIQGKFSSEGLASMAKGVNAQEKLAKALLQGDMSSDEKLASLFDNINEANKYRDEEDESFVFQEALIYAELMGITVDEEFAVNMDFDFMDEFVFETEAEPVSVKAVSVNEEPVNLFVDFADFVVVNPNMEIYEDTEVKKKRSKPKMEGCISLFDF